jgi:hypothetical protein
MKEQAGEQNDTAELADALNFLCAQKRTGKLHISKQGREGEVFLTEGGMITHAQCDRSVGLQALYFMHSWERATYTFTPKQTTEYRTIEMETSRILSLLAKRTREWDQIKEASHLNLDAILCLLPQARGTIRLKKEEWDILARIDGRRSLQEISDEIYMAPLDLFKAIQRFREAGLIGEGSRYSETACATFGRDFLAALEKELNQAIGAVAPIILEDALKDVEEAAGPLTGDKMEILLERLSNAIPAEESRVRFQQAARILAFASSGDEGLPQQNADQEGIEEIG